MVLSRGELWKEAIKLHDENEPEKYDRDIESRSWRPGRTDRAPWKYFMQLLNEFGEEGWDLVTIDPEHYYHFKRPKE